MLVKNKVKKLKLINFIKAVGFNGDKEVAILNGTVSKKIDQAHDFFIIDSKDCIISPGFIDPQVNGFNQCNFWDFPPPNFNEIDSLRLQLALHGVVAFCPTLITAPKEKILSSIDYINSYIKQTSDEVGAKILGIHIEGVFITRYGVHDSRYIQEQLTVKNLEPFIKENVILFTLAPELDQTGEAIGFLQKNNILVSVGHSNANYNEGKRVIKKYGLKTVTHMFNSLRGIDGFSHRGDKTSNLEVLKLKLQDKRNVDPYNDGILLALLEDKEVLCMVISDGVHVNKAVLKFLRDCKDESHLALASDMVSSDFFAIAKSRGILGGGQTALDKCVFNLVDWQVSSLEDSLRCASKPISSQLKVAGELGLGGITYDKQANIVLWDTKKNAVKGTIIGENVFLNY